MLSDISDWVEREVPALIPIFTCWENKLKENVTNNNVK
tara:strand:+ start:1196 stop:1309 length:114 start_codon:yes stop_codon:yes gene_type:complete